MPVSSKKSKAAAAKKLAFDELSPSEQIGHEIMTARADLAPSVQRILAAELTEGQRHRAISSFRAALDVVGDPHRDPRYAIANCGPAEPN
jgi:hypothetical protein